MHFRPLILCSILSSAVCASSHGQVQTPTAFQTKAIAAISSRPVHSITLNATAEWIAGSTHESGNAQLEASIDGSSSVQLSLGPASRTETQTSINDSRTCAWTDAAGKNHDILGANCFIALPWFAPGLFTQSFPQLPTLMQTSDDGEVSSNNATLHQVSFLLNLEGMNSAHTQQRIDRSKVKVLYDPQTFLPASLEYKVHPDNNELQNIEARVVFSNYQSVSGVMVPFHIEKFVNRSLQLTLDVSNASIE